MPRRPRRNERRFLPDEPKPASTYDEANGRMPKPATYTDKKGRVWAVDFLRLGEGSFSAGVRPWDATHMGFTHAQYGEVHQRVYRFQQGDDRSLAPESIYRALAASKRVPSQAEYAHKKRGVFYRATWVNGGAMSGRWARVSAMRGGHGQGVFLVPPCMLATDRLDKLSGRRVARRASRRVQCGRVAFSPHEAPNVPRTTPPKCA
jgi:hypothetical protein